MIIDRLLKLIYDLISNLLNFGLPQLPESVVNTFNTLLSHVVTGFSVLRAFFGPETFAYLSVLFGLVIALNSAYILYSIAFWVIRKIPIVDVKE